LLPGGTLTDFKYITANHLAEILEKK